MMTKNAYELKVSSVEFFFKSSPEKAVEYDVYCASKESLYDAISEGFKRGYISIMISSLGCKFNVFINTNQLEMVHFRAKKEQE